MLFLQVANETKSFKIYRKSKESIIHVKLKSVENVMKILQSNGFNRNCEKHELIILSQLRKLSNYIEALPSEASPLKLQNTLTEEL